MFVDMLPIISLIVLLIPSMVLITFIIRCERDGWIHERNLARAYKIGTDDGFSHASNEFKKQLEYDIIRALGGIKEKYNLGIKIEDEGPINEACDPSKPVGRFETLLMPGFSYCISIRPTRPDFTVLKDMKDFGEYRDGVKKLPVPYN